ncbi:UNVERIFIED_ORG: hypothetical protein ABIC54_001581 [Burkholderia sp. 1263]
MRWERLRNGGKSAPIRAVFSLRDVKKSGNEGDFVAAFLFATLLLLRQRES